MKIKKKKVWSTVMYWSFFVLSLYVTANNPVIRTELNQYNIFYAISNTFLDYRKLLFIGAFIVAVLSILIPIRIYKEKIKGAKTSDNESREALNALWLFLEAHRIIIIIVGVLILIFNYLSSKIF